MLFFFFVALVNFSMCMLCIFPSKRKEISPSPLLSTSLPVAPIEPPLHLCCFKSGWPDTLMTWRQTAWCYLWQVMQLSCCWGNNTWSARNFWTGSTEINGKLCRSWRDRKSAATLVGTHTHKHTHTQEHNHKSIYVCMFEDTDTPYKTMYDFNTWHRPTLHHKHHQTHTCPRRTHTAVTTTQGIGL